MWNENEMKWNESSLSVNAWCYTQTTLSTPLDTAVECLNSRTIATKSSKWLPQNEQSTQKNSIIYKYSQTHTLTHIHTHLARKKTRTYKQRYPHISYVMVETDFRQCLIIEKQTTYSIISPLWNWLIRNCSLPDGTISTLIYDNNHSEI